MIAEAAPHVTIAAGAWSSSAIRAPTFFSSSGSGMKKREASSIARMTSGGMIEPPRTVTTPTPLMTGLTPRLAYNEEGDEAVRLVGGCGCDGGRQGGCLEKSSACWLHDVSL